MDCIPTDVAPAARAADVCAGGTGYCVEFAGTTVQSLSIISNMAIEGGAKAGIIAPDHSTYEYLKQRPMCPTGEQWDTVLLHWKGLHTDDDALFDKVPCYNIGRDCIPTTMLSFIRLYS